MKLLEMILVCLILSTGLCFGQTEIIEHPQTQYALVGNMAIFHCKTKGSTSTYWLIDGEAVHNIHTQSTFVAQGFMFKFNASADNVYKNLTMTAPASVQTNNTEIKCRAIGRGNHNPYSRTSYLVVYKTFSPNRPAVQASYHDNHTSHYINISVYAQPLWPNYTLLEVEVNVTSNRNGLVIAELIIPLNISNSCQLIHILNSSETQYCSSVSISASVLSSNYGESETTSVELAIPRAPGNFSESAINHNVFFYPNGTPFLSISVQLPEGLCTYQNVNYTIIVEYEDRNSSKIVAGPLSFNYRGPGLVHHDIFGDFDLDQEYSVFVLVDSVAGNSKSVRHTFNTKLLVQFPTLTCSKSPTVDKVTLYYYKIAVGACLAVAIIVCLTFVGIVVSLYVHNKRKAKKLKINDSTSRVCNAMVDNPIYDGPVYESVQTQFETLTKQTTSTANTSTCNSQPSTPTSSEKSIRYVDPPSSAHQASKIRSKSFLSHPSAPEGDTENIPRCTSVSVPVIKKIPKQRNKLHLTLTLTGTDSAIATEAHDHSAQNCTSKIISAVNPVVLRDVDDNYAVMSPAGGRRALVGTDGWSELSPEDTDKYKE